MNLKAWDKKFEKDKNIGQVFRVEVLLKTSILLSKMIV